VYFFLTWPIYLDSHINTGEWQMFGLKFIAPFSYLQQCCWRFRSAGILYRGC